VIGVRVGDIVFVDPVLARFRRGFDPCGVVTAVRGDGVTVEHLDRWSSSGVIRRGYPVEWVTPTR
jgi:hypothetical protein